MSEKKIKRRSEKQYRAILDLRDDYGLNYHDFCHTFTIDLTPVQLLQALDQCRVPYYHIYIGYKEEGF